RWLAMVDTMLIDLKALLVEREDCDAGTVQRLRDGLAQGKSQYRTLRDVNDALKKKLESAAGPAAKKLHLKLGIVNFFLGHLGHANDLAGNDDEAIGFYERCLNHPPLHVGLLINLGILYEDSDKYEKAVECYRRVVNADPNHEQARLFLKDAQASVTMYYNPD